MSEPSPIDEVPTAVWLGTAVMLVAAVGPWPYGFYMLLRLIVFGASIYAGIRLGAGNLLMWAFVVTAIAYNPVFRVSFEREVWAVINVVSAVPFLIVGFRQHRRQKAKNNPIS